MRKMNIRLIEEKVKDVKTFAEAEERLTKEELIYYMCYRNGITKIFDGEESVLVEILQALGKNNKSVQHSLHLLDVAKTLLPMLSSFTYQ